MWWFLVLLGVLIALAGLAVIGLGVTIYVSAFGNTLITTGAVAASGGFVITAMGLVLRQLDRLTRQIERSYPAGEDEAEEPAAPPAARPARAGRNAAPRLSVDDLVAPEQDAEPPAPAARDRAERPQERNQERNPERTAERAAERQPERPPAPRRPAAPASLPPPEAGQPADPMLDARRQRLQRGPEPAPEAPAAPPAPPRPRTGYEPPPRPARAAPPEQAAIAPPAPAREPDEPRILKSGIVGGMAYTLYSDGSIQAELPTGVVRFASLQELRDHVSQAQQGDR
ncbi:hypothetical protein V5F63_01740 [Xanthobacter autotrophicus DSM 597]|uniref:hypothetical protein n=1 Tax=Xanthobacter wiegelii TaxID=3119913 RepID=UPI00372A154D